MIAIPLDSQSCTTVSKLYGNAPFFALLDEESGAFKVIENEEISKGPKIGAFLKKSGANSTVFYHMGEGVYKGCDEALVSVYTCFQEKLTLEEIFQGFKNSSLTMLDETNYVELLVSGESSNNCQCGCKK
ncbi:NifB/NifX family molybdenum-iron cluster-binding protein [Arcobacter sp. FWKO B]|uniref:NifB/NifX family molybdenum-iron cluster-binding protein n=1 Tax=Arcobacter sp. FWKO B TaxID=2593672 RepID=UPI0018A3D2DB|nr:NifB/NifX family molybdenum-iron cluster-binding protein [Arcobacter sp. FWKO B]QOG11263.1 dinitrogenase iron-molybdenum cofactor biosynthesis protein [Arcobacter sp. FWKO B]